MTDESFSDSTVLIFEDTYYTRSFALEKFASGYKLVGVMHRQPVHPGVNKSQCFSHVEDAPIRECSCGFYAYLENRAFDTYTSFPNHVRAIIRGSGKTIVQENGVRLENIEVMALSSDSLKHRKQLRQMFPDVPVYDSDQELLDETQQVYPIKNFSLAPSIQSRTNLKKSFQNTLTPRLEPIFYYERPALGDFVKFIAGIMSEIILCLALFLIMVEAITLKTNVTLPPEIVLGAFGFWCIFNTDWMFSRLVLGVCNIFVSCILLLISYSTSDDALMGAMLLKGLFVCIVGLINIAFLTTQSLMKRLTPDIRDVLYKPRMADEKQ